MPPPLDSYASPHGDPTPLQNPLHSQLMKHLRALKDKQARHLSHLQFIRASLRNNITPGGLKINISLQADEADKNLRKKWKKIIQRTQIQLLKLLKIHHRVRAESLRHEISNLEQELTTGPNTESTREAISTIQQRVEKLKKKLNKRKRQKLTKLVQNKTQQRKRIFKRTQILPTPTQNHTPRTVVNLSEVNLSQGEINLLSRGLKFAPIPPRVNRFELKKDLEAFARRLRLKEFFYNSDEEEDEFNPNQHRFKEKSTWNPPRNRDPALETYLSAVERDLWWLTRSTKRKDNLTPPE